MNFRIASVAAVVTLLTACAPDVQFAMTPDMPNAGIPECDDSKKRTQSDIPTAFIRALNCLAGDNNSPFFASEFYVRPIIKWTPGGGGFLRNYSDEERGYISNFLVNSDTTLKVSVTVGFSDPGVKSTVDLLVMQNKGNASGDTWTTMFVDSRVGTLEGAKLPFVRATARTALDVTAKFSSTVDVGTQFFSATKRFGESFNLGGASALFSKLNKIDFLSEFFHKELESARIFKDSKTEEIVVGQLLDRWRPGGDIRIQARIPLKAKLPNGADVILDQGYWSVSLSNPTYSIFDKEEICNEGADVTGPNVLSLPATVKKEYDLRGANNPLSAEERRSNSNSKRKFRNTAQDIYDKYSSNNCKERIKDRAARIAYRVSAQDVLFYPVQANTTLESYLKGQPWYTALRDKIKVTNPDRNAAAEFCDQVVNTAYDTFSFNKLDSSLALWAIVSASSDFSGIRSKFNGSGTCRAHIEGLRLDFEPPT